MITTIRDERGTEIHFEGFPIEMRVAGDETTITVSGALPTSATTTLAEAAERLHGVTNRLCDEAENLIGAAQPTSDDEKRIIGAAIVWNDHRCDASAPVWLRHLSDAVRTHQEHRKGWDHAK